MIEYHNMQPVAKPREDRSSSCGNISAKSASGGVPKNKYAHVQSKVKQYIQDIKTENEQKVSIKNAPRSNINHTLLLSSIYHVMLTVVFELLSENTYF